MDQLTASIQLLIPGFVYCCSLFLGIMISTRKYDLSFLDHKKEYYPFLAIVIIFASFAIGYSINLISQYFYHLCQQLHSSGTQNYYDPQKLESIATNQPKRYDNLSDSYLILVMLRNLAFSTFILTGMLFWWILKGNYKKYIIPTLLYGILLGLFFLASWRIHRCQYIALKKALGLS